MSLQVWLPLHDGTLTNQGLSDTTATIMGNVSLTSAGKLGKCAYFANNCANAIHMPGLQQTSNFSWSCWFNCAGTGATPYQFLLSEGRDAGYRGINLRLTKEGTGLFVQFGDNSTVITTTTITISLNTWYHVAVVVTDNIINVYLNGILKTTNSFIVAPNYTQSNNRFVIGKMAYSYTSTTSYFCFNGYVNDVRIYDHALSAKEVKELAKGLVLHYKLDKVNGGNTNLLVNTGFDSRYSQTTGWDTTKNGTQMASSWGGYNNGVANQATVYHAHLKEINEEWVYEYIKTDAETWLGISQAGLQSKLTAGKTYTFSWEEYHVSGTNRVSTGLYYFKTGATSAAFHLGLSQAESVIRKIGVWQKYTYTFVAPSDADWSKNISWYVYGHYNGKGTFYLRHLKLEEGNKATPWTPNSADAAYIALGYNQAIEYDCSGYGYNGILNNSPINSSNTTRYNNSISLDGINQTVQIGNLSTIVPSGEFTFNIWFYKTELNSKSYDTIFGGPSGFEIECRNAAETNPVLVPWNWGKSQQEYTFNTWHMLTMTRNANETKWYYDGNLWATSSAGSIPSGDYFLGSWRDTTSQNYKGLLSDARIYTTALSADDVKELYQTAASIDNHGNVYAYEVVE